MMDIPELSSGDPVNVTIMTRDLAQSWLNANSLTVLSWETMQEILPYLPDDFFVFVATQHRYVKNPKFVADASGQMHENRDVYGKCDKSGWTWIVRLLSDFNFDRLNHEISGAPVYRNSKGDVWPKPAAGMSVVWPDSATDMGLPDERMR